MINITQGSRTSGSTEWQHHFEPPALPSSTDEWHEYGLKSTASSLQINLIRFYRHLLWMQKDFFFTIFTSSPNAWYSTRPHHTCPIYFSNVLPNFYRKPRNSPNTKLWWPLEQKCYGVSRIGSSARISAWASARGKMKIDLECSIWAMEWHVFLLATNQ